MSKIKDVIVTLNPQGDQSRIQRSYKNIYNITTAIDGWVKVIPARGIRPWNAARQPSEEEQENLYFYPEMIYYLTRINELVSHPGRYCVVGGPLDNNICPSESEALKFA